MILSFDKKYSLGIICVMIFVLTLCTGTVAAFSDTNADFGGDIFAAATTTFANTEVSHAATDYTAETDEVVTSAVTIEIVNTEVSYTFITRP